MVRTRKKATRAGKRVAGRKNGKAPAPVKELAEIGLLDECTRAEARATEQALLGQLKCLKRMLDGSNKSAQGEQPEMDRNGFSQAMAWKAESEWQGELREADGETGAGSREPEFQSD